MPGTVLGYLPVVVGAAFGVWYPVALLRSAVRARGGVRPVDRLTLVDGLVGSLLALLFAWLWVPWQVVPPLLWAVLVGVVIHAVLLAAPVWRRLPWVHGGAPRRRLAGSAAGATVVLAAFALVLW